VCERCAHSFPIIDGISLLTADPDRWLAEERLTVLCRQDLPGPLLERLVRGDMNPLHRSLRRLWTYANSRSGPMQDAVARAMADLPGPVLELGAGIGAHGRTDVTAVDLDWTLLSRNPAAQRVLADALNLPWQAGRFASVVSLNLLDSCADPAGLIASMDAQLAPGGRLLLASPLAYEDHITPIGAQLDADAVGSALSARGFQWSVAAHDWPLRTHPRTLSIHAGLLWTAHRRAQAPAHALR
jgi:SAM-dependent methyltransferase